MKEQIGNFEHYYKLRMSYQQNLSRLTKEDLREYKECAADMLVNGNFTTSFERERLADFIDEVELEILNFVETKRREARHKEIRKVVEKKNYEIIKKVTESEKAREKILSEGMFIDSNHDLVIVIKKDQQKNFYQLFEKLALMASIISTINFLEAEKMLGLSRQYFVTMRKKYGF